MLFEKIDHISMTVKNLEGSLKWYGNLFGFKKVEEGSRGKDRWCIIALNDFMLCLNEYPNRKQADQNLDESYYQLYHFGLRVTDKELWEKLLLQHQVQVNYGGAYHYPHSISWYVVDPSGHEIEVSYAEGRALKF